MAYGGGLLGYAGNETATSQSKASGNVTVQAPYPYAGGLVGYNYGTLGGAGGSTISQCYTTGAVSADATTSSVPGLPYAGGLAGYNSSKGSVIEDCYTTGLVSAKTTTGFAWAGGVVGANANNAAVNRTYSNGDVTATAGEGALPSPQPQTSEGALAGGIAGYNYYTADTAITASFALTKEVTAIHDDPLLEAAYRVVGRNGNPGDPVPLLDDNSGSESMDLIPTHTPVSDPAGLDGADCLTRPDQEDYEDAGWNFSNVWGITAPYTYPYLRATP
jgi:hypothetical protein